MGTLPRPLARRGEDQRVSSRATCARAVAYGGPPIFPSPFRFPSVPPKRLAASSPCDVRHTPQMDGTNRGHQCRPTASTTTPATTSVSLASVGGYGIPESAILPTVIVYAIVDVRSSSTNPLGDTIETFIRREDTERFIEELCGDDPELTSHLRIEGPPRASRPPPSRSSQASASCSSARKPTVRRRRNLHDEGGGKRAGACPGVLRRRRACPHRAADGDRDSRAGFQLTDIFTVPADRLISENLAARSATVTIVPSILPSRATQLVFRNRANS